MDERYADDADGLTLGFAGWVLSISISLQSKGMWPLCKQTAGEGSQSDWLQVKDKRSLTGASSCCSACDYIRLRSMRRYWLETKPSCRYVSPHARVFPIRASPESSAFNHRYGAILSTAASGHHRARLRQQTPTHSRIAYRLRLSCSEGPVTAFCNPMASWAALHALKHLHPLTSPRGLTLTRCVQGSTSLRQIAADTLAARYPNARTLSTMHILFQQTSITVTSTQYRQYYLQGHYKIMQEDEQNC